MTGGGDGGGGPIITPEPPPQALKITVMQSPATVAARPVNRPCGPAASHARGIECIALRPPGAKGP